MTRHPHSPAFVVLMLGTVKSAGATLGWLLAGLTGGLYLAVECGVLHQMDCIGRAWERWGRDKT